MTMGRHEEAMTRMKKSQDLDPLSLIINVAVGWALYFARRYDEAIEQLRRTVDLDPNYPVTYWILGLLLRKTGCYELAITEGEKGVKLSGGSPMMRAALAHTLGAAGRTKEALEMLDDLTKLAKQKYVAPYFFAGIHIGLGENDRAIEYLEKCYEEHSHWLIYLHIDPSMDGLRDNPGFQGLLRRVGLPALTTGDPRLKQAEAEKSLTVVSRPDFDRCRNAGENVVAKLAFYTASPLAALLSWYMIAWLLAERPCPTNAIVAETNCLPQSLSPMTLLAAPAVGLPSVSCLMCSCFT